MKLQSVGAAAIGAAGCSWLRRRPPSSQTATAVRRARLMKFTKPLAAAAMATGAIVLAAPAQANASWAGTYVMTDTSSGGNVMKTTYTVSSCGDGCAGGVAVQNKSWTFRATLSGTQWTWDSIGDARCNDGSFVNSASNDHFSIDATTLRGTKQVAWNKNACGENDSGKTFTHTIVFDKLA
jgi:hypothetical protein